MSEATQRTKKNKNNNKNTAMQELKWIPLGGLGEVGKNLSAFEYCPCGGPPEIIIVDCGLKFPEEEMLGIDLVIPDAQYLFDNKDKIRALFVTHGHEDHIGALPFILPKLDVPVYATALTLGLIEHKMKEARTRYKADLRVIRPQESATVGSFTVDFIGVCHSIPDSLALAIHTPLGTVVHTGDFKLDATPIDGRVTDYRAFSELGAKGVLLLLSDSTNIEREGFTASERTVGQTFERLFRLHKDRRIVAAAFASNLHRAQQFINTAMKYNRKVALVGRSMIGNVEIARRLGYLDAPDDIFIPQQQIAHMPPNRLAVLTTGSQGEPFSGLVLMSKGEHKQIRLGEKDLVIISATAIPGNEKLVSRTINMLFSCGAEVVYEREQAIHVSGHAAKEELKLMINMIKPQCFAPIHGEYRHLVRHAQLAKDMGIPQKNVFIMQNGDVLSITGAAVGKAKNQTNQAKPSLQVKIAGRVQSGAILVDGVALGEFEGSLLQERRALSEDGIIMMSVILDAQGRISAPIKVESRGFLHPQQARGLYTEIEGAVKKAVEAYGGSADSSYEVLPTMIRKRVRDVLGKYGRSYPTLAPLITYTE